MSIKQAKKVLKIESGAISSLIPRLGKSFQKAIRMICNCKGRIVVTGMGKPGLIARKISATLASMGIPSLFLHPAEAVHGDLGMVTKSDLVIALSNSGETEEIIRLIATIKKIGAGLISLTGNLKSSLARNSEVALDVGVKKEACPLNLAPTASTTAMLAMGDALAIVVVSKKDFKHEDYAFFHPGGVLGKKLLLKVEDIMRSRSASPTVNENRLVKEALLIITKARAGSASVVDSKGRLRGIFTDGDLRRHLETEPDLLVKKIKEVMTKKPATITKDKLAAEAFKVLKEKKIDELPVVDERNRPIGLVDVQDLLKAGLV
ncbi:MAG: KpsF/GutQ family sugar-phosphate isomerase [Candidatus Omnitrophota bacterium]|nr:KpsF/GutQ family sugar-phosphate isomerase [Candidatus Omnitrophota bacterium]